MGERNLETANIILKNSDPAAGSTTDSTAGSPVSAKCSKNRFLPEKNHLLGLDLVAGDQPVEVDS